MAKLEKVQLTKEQIDNIKNYKNDIKTLESFVQGVRQNIGMYIGHRGILGYLNMIREVLQNAIDELMRINSPCNSVAVTFDRRTYMVTIEDNGKGIPLGEIIRIFTKEHTSSNYASTKTPFNYTSGRHGVGAKVTNALSLKFIVESYVLGEARKVEFNDGYPWNKGEQVIPNKDGRQGTVIKFIPSFDMLGEFECSIDDPLGLIRLIVPLTTLGSKVYYTGIDLDGKEHSITVENVDGILSFLVDTCKAPIIKPIEYSMDTGYLRAHIALTYDAENIEVSETIMPFSNFCPTDNKSSHVIGFIAGLKKYFVKYMNTIYLVNGADKRKKKISVIESDIRTGLRVVLDVAHLNPNFTGQAKETLDNPDMEEFVKDLTEKSLEQWAKDNPQALQKLCKYFKEIADIRCNADEKKIKLTTNYSQSIGGLPAKFTPPTLLGKKEGKGLPFEFYMVEGDSAGGSAKTFRYNKLQGIMPLRGKMINCFENSLEKCLNNEEVQALMSIMNYGQGINSYKQFNIEKFIWDKVISSADADIDGAHINAINLRFMLRFYPSVIEAGKFYKSVPPLYSINQGKNKKYFTSRIDYVEYMQKEFSKKYSLETINGKQLTSKEVIELLYLNIDYIYELKKIGDRYKVEYKLLELYLFNRNESVATIGKLIKKNYRFMEIKSINETPTAEGIIDKKYNTLFIGERLIKDSNKVIDIINNNLYLYYKVNGTVSSLYDIMNAYESNQPSSITRFKGLGEMDKEELALSTIYPGDMGQRVLIRYTMQDAVNEINQIRYYESNKNKLLENVNVSRIDLLD